MSSSSSESLPTSDQDQVPGATRAAIVKRRLKSQFGKRRRSGIKKASVKTHIKASGKIGGIFGVFSVGWDNTLTHFDTL